MHAEKNAPAEFLNSDCDKQEEIKMPNSWKLYRLKEIRYNVHHITLKEIVHYILKEHTDSHSWPDFLWNANLIHLD